MSDFVHLHCHTEYSLLDGAIRLKDLTARAKDFGMPATAITDHGNMYGTTYFYKACKDMGIKPIIGCEVYVSADHTDRTSDVSRVRHHLILLASDNAGYHNLVKLVSTGWMDGLYYKPRVDKALLRKYSEGLIALSACIAGEVPRTLMGANRLIRGGGSMDDAIQLAREYSDIYPDRFYLEVQSNDLPDQMAVNTKLYELAEHTGLPLVATNDCHYLDKNDVEAHDLLLCIQQQTTVTNEKRWRFDARDLYYKSAEEMEAAFRQVPEALANTMRIAEACNVKMQFGDHYFPVYGLPKGVTLEGEFRTLSREGLQRRLDAYPGKENLEVASYWERLEWELKVICEMGFPGYFLIVQDFINWAKDQGIPVGPGRGSAAGSLVAWALRITNLDPLPYNLLFERFLNNERVSLPDIDVDFCEDRRGEVIAYVADKYGHDSVAQITTFGTMKAKAALRDVGRAMDIPLPEVDRIAKLVPDDLKMTLRKALEAEPTLATLYKEDTKVRKLVDISMRLEGLARHASTHAAGVVVSDKPMTEYLPMYKGKKGELVTQYDGKMVEEVGLVKFDFLGLRTMTLIVNAVKAIAAQGKTPPNLDTLGLDDPEAYEVYARGDTDGVFQVESSGMRQYLRMLKPTCFEDVIAMLALYRPGPLGSGMVDEFIKRKHGEVRVSYPLPELESCLKDTYGVIVYQEQVMQIAQIVAGYTLGGADLLRRAMGKKNPEAMAKERSRFVDGSKARQVPEKKANEIFDLMEKFAEYGFNKSHSAAYALVSYHTAYLKAHYPVEFMSALLTSEIGNQDKILKYIAVCKDMDIEVRQPNVQVSLRAFTAHEGAVIYGLGGVKNVGDEAIREIVETRQSGPYASFLDLCSRVNLRKVTKRVLESLIKSGACDCFGVSRASLVAALNACVTRAQKKQKEKESAQISMLALMPAVEEAARPGLGFACEEEATPEWDEDEKLRFEKEALGFFLTSHPLQQYRHEVLRLDLHTLEDARDMPARAEIRCAVLVTTSREIVNRRGNRMAFIGVEDLTASGEVTFFTDELQAARELLQSDQPLLLTATIDRRDNNGYNGNGQNGNDTAMPEEQQDDDDDAPREIKLRAVSVQSLADACNSSDLPYYFEADPSTLTPPALEELKAILQRHQGQVELHVGFRLDDVHCIMRLGSQWMVQPGPGFHRELHRWQSETRKEARPS